MKLNKSYYSPTSLENDIATLMNPDTPCNAVKLANLISKYVICFALNEGIGRAISYGEYVEMLEHIKSILYSGNRTDDGIILGVKYQLQMILDIGATVEIMLDIIEEIERRGGDIGGFSGLDLGLGSGILMLAQYIGAKRSRKKNPIIRGIEKDVLAQFLSEKMIVSLGVGIVVLGDSQNVAIYPKEQPHFISNENLSTRGIPFRLIRRDEQDLFEPFLENIRTLRNVYGDNIFQNTGGFPRGISMGNIFDRVEGKRFLTGEHYGIHIADRLVQRHNPSACLYPVRILIGTQWKNLDDIGLSHVESGIFDGGRDSITRWGFVSEGGLDSIYRMQNFYLASQELRSKKEI